MSTNRFAFDKKVQFHNDMFGVNEILVLTVFKKLGYKLIVNNKIDDTCDIFIGISSFSDGDKHFSLPDETIMNAFIDTKYIDMLGEIMLRENPTLASDIIRKKILVSKSFKFVKEFSRAGDNNNLEDISELLMITSRLFDRILKNEIEDLGTKVYIEEQVEKFKNRDTLVLDLSVPWNKHFQLVAGFKYIVYPSGGKWRLYCVPESKKYATTGKVRLPKLWLKSKPNGCIYVKENRYFAIFVSKESILEVFSV